MYVTYKLDKKCYEFQFIKLPDIVTVLQYY